MTEKSEGLKKCEPKKRAGHYYYSKYLGPKIEGSNLDILVIKGF